MRALKGFGSVIRPLLGTLLLGIIVTYFVFAFDSRSQVSRPPVEIASGSSVEKRIEALERSVSAFEQKYQHSLASAEASSWYSEKILRLITVVSIIGTFMTLLGFFSLSGLKATADDAKRALEDSKKEFDQFHARASAVKDKLVAEGRALGLEAIGGPEQPFVAFQAVNYQVEDYDVALTAWAAYADFDWSLYDLLGRYFLSTQQFDKALVRFNEAVNRNASAYPSLYLKGYCLGFLARRRSADPEVKRDVLLKAQWSFEAAYRGDTKNAFYALGMGWIMDEIERYDEAIKWYEEALKLRPGLVEAKYNIGCALAKSGRPEPAYDLIFAIRGEPQIRQVLAAEAETELKAIKNWNAEKFRSLLT